jgi:Uma2 family endonuclease
MSAAASIYVMPRLFPPIGEDKNRYEIIDGIKVGMPPMSTDSSAIGADLARLLSNYGIEHNRGKAYPEMLIKLPLTRDRNRRPDVIFVPFSQWPKGRAYPSTNAWDILPDICIEVISPSDLADEVITKLTEYFESGVRQVWIVYPRHQLLYVYESPVSVRGLTRADELDGGAVLPGFRLKLADLFPEPAPPAPPPA